MSVHASCAVNKGLIVLIRVGPLCRCGYVDWYALSESERLAACPIEELTVSEMLILPVHLSKIFVSNPHSKIRVAVLQES